MATKNSSIKGYYGSYEAAYADVGLRFKKTGKYSIQMSNEYRDKPWVLIYYGNFWVSE